MKYVCKKSTQLRIEGKITFCERGRVYELKEANKFFECIEEESKYSVDFLKASEDELKKTKWKFAEAAEAIKEAFDVELNNEKGTKKSDVIAQILDARYRSIDTERMKVQ